MYKLLKVRMKFINLLASSKTSNSGDIANNLQKTNKSRQIVFKVTNCLCNTAKKTDQYRNSNRIHG